MPVMIHGFCDPEFERVKLAFEANFTDREEVGAAVCVYADGRPVVDLWGGTADPASGKAWDRDTLVCMMSVGKGMAALCVHRLVQAGKIDLDLPMGRYWPEFGQAGKELITVRQVLGGRSGTLYGDSATNVLDWDDMTAAIAAQPPAWEPGSRGAYQSMTMGFMLGELVRRVDGRLLNTYFQEEIAGPLGIEYGWGLSPEQEARTAPVISNVNHHTLQAFADPSTKLGRAWRARPKGGTFYNTPGFRQGVLPSSNGHGNARGVARVFAALSVGGSLDGVDLLEPQEIELARTLQWDELCAMTDRPYRYGLGFFLNTPNLAPMGDNPRAFGHPGAGGALGFADPEKRIAFGYSPNHMCSGAGSGDRATALVDALYS